MTTRRAPRSVDGIPTTPGDGTMRPMLEVLGEDRRRCDAASCPDAARWPAPFAWWDLDRDERLRTESWMVQIRLGGA